MQGRFNDDYFQHPKPALHKEEWVLVYYVELTTGLGCYIQTPTTLEYKNIVADRALLRQTVQRLHDSVELFLNARHKKYSEEAEKQPNSEVAEATPDMKKDEENYKLQLDVLTEYLLEPLQDHLKTAKRVLFCPFAELWRVPFGALSYKGEPLISSVSVGVIPSVLFLNWALQRLVICVRKMSSILPCIDIQNFLNLLCRSHSLSKIALDPPLIVGNPYIMSKIALPRATDEADAIAKMYKVLQTTPQRF